jgi:succinoglycan biosynthesis protein ExoA
MLGRQSPLVSVIVPCRNEAGCIEPMLKSLLAQQQIPGGFEVVLADGASTDGTSRLLAQAQKNDQRIRVIHNSAQVVSAGLNAAIRAATGEIVIRMDAHTEYAQDYILRCVDALQRTGAENVGGAARTKAETYLQKAVAAAYHSRFSVGGARFHDLDYEGFVDTVTYGCWRKAVFHKFGYFDEELVRNQDDEHNLRITRSGGKIWQSRSIRSWYRPRESLVALFKQYMQYGYWKVRVIQKHKLPASPRHLVPAAFLLVLMLLAAAAFASVPALWLLIWVVGTYALATTVASVEAAWRSELKLLPVLPVVFACYHFGYGYGFLHGVWDFVVCRRSAKPAFAALTR